MLTWLRKHTKMIIVAVAVLFAFSMLYGLSFSGWQGEAGGGKQPDQIAKINGESVDFFRYRELLNRIVQSSGANLNPHDLAMLENMALSQAVDFTMMLQEAKKKVRVPGREVDAAVEGIMKQQKIPSKRELGNALKQMGLTVGKFRDLIKDEMLVQKFNQKIREEVVVTKDDLREVRASHILVTNEAQAKLVLDKVRKGEDFASLAKQYSKDPGSGAKGGDLGFFSAGMMVESFEKAAFALNKGEHSGIIQSPFGYHIIKLTDSRLRQFAGKEPDPQKAALEEKRERVFRRWYGEVRSKAKVEVLNHALLGHSYRFGGRPQQAAAEYKLAVAAYPPNPYLHIYLGDTYLMLGQKNLAFVEYENAVRLEGGNPELYLIVGQAYDDAGQKELAAAQYKKASLVAGDNKALHERLLKLFQQMKRPREAATEQSEIRRLAKKEKFEKEVSGQK